MPLDDSGHYLPDTRMAFRFSSGVPLSLEGTRQELAFSWAAAMADNDAGIEFGDPVPESLGGVTVLADGRLRLDGTRATPHGLDFVSCRHGDARFGLSRVTFSSSPAFADGVSGYPAVLIPDYLG